MAVARIRKAQGLNRGSGEVFPRKRSYQSGRQAVFHQASPSCGGEVDRQIHAVSSYQVRIGRGVFPQKRSYHPGRRPSVDSTPAAFRVRSGRGGNSDHPGRQSVFHLASPSCSGEVDRRAGAAGSFRVSGSPWQRGIRQESTRRTGDLLLKYSVTVDNFE